MTVYVDHRDAVYTEHLNSRGAQQRQFDYFGKESEHQFGPEAFLVDYGPERTTTAHFHSVDQFQIFFGAAGARYQRHQIPAVELHYADAFVTYGPFSAGEERIRFFTLRPCQGQFKGEMPSERHKLRYQGRRGIHVDLEPLLASRAASGASIIENVIPTHDDGLSATVVVAGPDTAIRLDHGRPHGGAYVCVLSGSVESGDRSFGPFSLAWEAAGHEDHDDVAAGRDGAVVLSMTYPFPPTPEAHDMAEGEARRLTGRAQRCDTRSDLERPFRN
jgi:hypothetical protein